MTAPKNMVTAKYDIWLCVMMNELFVCDSFIDCGAAVILNYFTLSANFLSYVFYVTEKNRRTSSRYWIYVSHLSICLWMVYISMGMTHKNPEYAIYFHLQLKCEYTASLSDVYSTPDCTLDTHNVWHETNAHLTSMNGWKIIFCRSWYFYHFFSWADTINGTACTVHSITMHKRTHTLMIIIQAFRIECTKHQ